MRNIFVLAICLSAFTAAAQSETDQSNPILLSNQIDSLNFYLGLSLGFDIKEAPFEVNPQLITRGFNEAFADSSSYDRMSSQVIIKQLQMALEQQISENTNQAAAENLEKGKAFLLENGKREEVTTTESGLQYEILTEGSGPVPADTSTVTVHYKGQLLNGTVFDSSLERGEPVSFPLNQVIAGWTEGVQLMSKGSTYNLYIPPSLGYGPREQGPIPANSVLIFRIQLLEIK